MMAKKTLVFGASPNPNRYAYLAVKQLQATSIEVIALGRRKGEIEGVKILTDYPNTIEGLHTIALYIGPKHQPEYYDYLIGLNPKRILFNPGTENQAFIKKIEAKGIIAEIGCTLVLLSIDAY